MILLSGSKGKILTQLCNLAHEYAYYLEKQVVFLINYVMILTTLGVFLASTLVMKLIDACRERIFSRKSNLHFYSRKQRILRSSCLRAACPPL